MKLIKGVILIEVIFSIVLFSIVIFGTMQMILSLNEKIKRDSSYTQDLLKLEATRLFLSKNKNFSKLLYTNNSLYYSGNLLLNQISKFTTTKSFNILSIDICLKNGAICQVWKISF